MLISLDIDGVLANEDDHLNDTTRAWEMLHSTRQSFSDYLSAQMSTDTWWMARKPLWEPSPTEVEDMLARLDEVEFQVVSKRGRWVQPTSLIWFQVHFAWLASKVRSFVCVGEIGSKLYGLTKPDVAIDDSINAIREYRIAHVPVIAVSSSRTASAGSMFPEVPVVARVDEALRLATSAGFRS